VRFVFDEKTNQNAVFLQSKKKLVDLLNKTIKKITPSFNHKNGPKIVAESWVGSGEHSGMRTALED